MALGRMATRQFLNKVLFGKIRLYNVRTARVLVS
jgi:hypothetical protein